MATRRHHPSTFGMYGHTQKLFEVTFTHRLIMANLIPNASLASGSVDNVCAPTPRRTRFQLSVCRRVRLRFISTPAWGA
eukprot:126664-Pyramimonas_sp.AAC.2